MSTLTSDIFVEHKIQARRSIILLTFAQITNSSTDEATLLEADQKFSEVERFIYGHHASEDSLEQSKREGCVACTGMGDENAESVERFGYSTTFSVEFMDQNDGTKFQMLINHGDGYINRIAFAPYPRKRIPGKHKASARAIADISLQGRIEFLHSKLTNSTEDPATWHLVEWWLSTCVATHKACGFTHGSKWAPTRLLKLNAANDTFQLVSNDEVNPGSLCAALSHCWGSKSWASRLILNSDNDASLSREQPLAMLPTTFRDAFTIVRRLNLQYIWIDRFCIYQDSEEDWQKEASMMDTVYRNSYVCISALSANVDDGGCFFTRDLQAVKPSIVSISRDGESQPELYSAFRLDSNAWQRTFSREVLISRAWVVQERLLVPRILHFGKDQIYWECNEEFRSETNPDYEWRRTEAARYKDFADFSELQTAWKVLIGGHIPDKKDPTVALGNEWLGILRFYSGRELSHEQDKLVAISAIAKDMKRRLENLGEPTDYFAGIWGLWLLHSLLWSVSAYAAQKHRPQHYRAPSWSWASVDSAVHPGAVEFWHSSDRWVASVAHVEVTHLTDDDTGRVVSGAVTLRETLLRVLLERSTRSWLAKFLVRAWEPKRFETVQGDPVECNLREREVRLT